MILLMDTNLKVGKEPAEDSFPDSWFYENDGTVCYEEELHLPGGSARGDPGVFDLKDDGILNDINKLHQLGVRGSIHFADSCGPKYICITLMDEGVFTQTGSVIWDSQLKKTEITESMFLVLDKGSVPKRNEDDELYTTFNGAPYKEESLREWANDRWGTPLDATLEVIARDIRQGGWLLYRGIWPVSC